jgi:inhibitor of KinA sporulation pathway (predicted exonuclease)
MSKNRIIIDLEATCDDQGLIPKNENEIIEIGACLVNSQFDVLSEFQVFIKPVIHPALTSFCIELTKITQNMVNSAPVYDEAMYVFSDWIDKCQSQYGAIEQWGSWGGYDRNQFARNAILLNREPPRILTIEHVNIKSLYGKVLGLKKAPGLGKALNQFEGLAFQGTPHRGIDDALNIARLAPIAFGLVNSARADKNS